MRDYKIRKLSENEFLIYAYPKSLIDGKVKSKPLANIFNLEKKDIGDLREDGKTTADETYRYYKITGRL